MLIDVNYEPIEKTEKKEIKTTTNTYIDRQTNRQTDRQTDRQTQTHTQAHTQHMYIHIQVKICLIEKNCSSSNFYFEPLLTKFEFYFVFSDFQIIDLLLNK